MSSSDEISTSTEDIESLIETQPTDGAEKKYEKQFNRADILKILEDSTTKDDHEDILSWIEKKSLSLYSKDDTLKKSLIRTLLEEAGNGFEFVEKVMNSYISPSCSNQNSNAYNVKMDFSGLMSETGIEEDKHESRDSVLDDIVELKLKNQGHFWNLYRNGEKEMKENCSKSCLGKYKLLAPSGTQGVTICVCPP